MSVLKILSYAYTRITKTLLLVPFHVLWIAASGLERLGASWRQSLVVDDFRSKYWLDFVQERLKESTGKVRVGNNIIQFGYVSSKEFWRFKTISRKEPDTVQWLKKNACLYPHATLIDVGANIGIYSILWMKLGEGDAYCFEPLPTNVTSLLENLRLNHFEERATVFQVAASCTTSLTEFNSPSMSPGEGFGSIRDSSPQAKSHQFMVATIPLSSLEINRESILKIDVEGAELEVIRGLGNHLESGEIKSVLFEKNSNQIEIELMLAKYGYRRVDSGNNGNLIFDLVTKVETE
jgi:FkbM family methyltransferase